jgi:hypothetical protein
MIYLEDLLGYVRVEQVVYENKHYNLSSHKYRLEQAAYIRQIVHKRIYLSVVNNIFQTHSYT